MPVLEFRIGDRVRIHKPLTKTEQNESPLWAEQRMDSFDKQEAVINYIDTDLSWKEVYHYYTDNTGGWAFNAKWLSLVRRSITCD